MLLYLHWLVTLNAAFSDFNLEYKANMGTPCFPYLHILSKIVAKSELDRQKLKILKGDIRT